MGILSDEEKQERHISFLTTMSRLFGTSSIPRRYIHYQTVKI
ncbi:MAG: hypothetical protein QF619_06570 [Candidatus Binatia bacterium]|jgi:hypothetical protein|nr:hypothetical protein [Candidatus Binatia bacterium]